MAKLTIGDVFTKVSYIFKKDTYFIQNRYCIGGVESEGCNVSRFLCIFSPDVMNILKEEFQDNEVVFITDIKKVKKDYDTYLKTDLSDEQKKEIIDIKDKMEKEILNIDTWKPFNFSEDEAKNLIDFNNTHELFSDNTDVPAVTISKAIFPIIKSTEVSSLYYNVKVPEDKNELVDLYVSYDTQWFQVYNKVQYIETI